jgi:hypothetical protein
MPPLISVVLDSTGGKKEIVILFKVDLQNKDPNWEANHIVTQPIITLNGDKASGIWCLYMLFWDINTPKGLGVRVVSGRHDCEYVKVNGEWKYSSVKFIMPWPEKLKSLL